jgi:hypothetical protein
MFHQFIERDPAIGDGLVGVGLRGDLVDFVPRLGYGDEFNDPCKSTG